MITRCKICGYWFEHTDEEACPECGENMELITYGCDEELIEKLNDYEFVRQNLKIVETEKGYDIKTKFGEMPKGRLTGKFITFCDIVNPSKYMSNHIFKVMDVETKEQLFVGTKEECKEYIEKHETIWKELVIKEWYAK